MRNHTRQPLTRSRQTSSWSGSNLDPKGSGRLPKDSKAKADQIRTLGKTRLVKRIGKLENTLMEEIEAAIRIHLELG